MTVNTSDGGLLDLRLRFYYYDCVNTSDGGLLVDYVFITITVSIPLMVDY